MAELTRSNQEWREQLTPEQYRILREAGTEPPFSGRYVHVKEDGVYRCAACGAELFSAQAKFDSGTGWPSFTEPTNAARVELLDDFSHGMHRTEVRCRRCRSDRPALLHQLGRARPGQRHCRFVERADIRATPFRPIGYRLPTPDRRLASAGREEEGRMQADCTFCQIVSGELPADYVDEDERTVAFMDI